MAKLQGSALRRLRVLAAAGLILLLLLRAQAAVEGGRTAIAVWLYSVAPALLPFLALMPLITGQTACAAYARLLSGLMRPLFGLSGAAAPVLAAGMVAGSPLGALTLKRVAAAGQLGAGEVRRLGLALCGFSPAYLIAGVGTALFGSPALGLRLALIQAGVQLLLLCCLRILDEPDPAPMICDAPPDAGGMASAISAVLVICGYMVVFGAGTAVLEDMLGGAAGLAVRLAGDVPGGLAALVGVDMPWRNIALGAAVGGGGLCLAAQNLRVLRPLGVRTGTYLAVRGLAAALTGLLCGWLLPAQAAAVAERVSFAYPLSLLAACLLALPGLVLLTREMNLNKGAARQKAP